MKFGSVKFECASPRRTGVPGRGLCRRRGERREAVPILVRRGRPKAVSARLNSERVLPPAVCWWKRTETKPALPEVRTFRMGSGNFPLQTEPFPSVAIIFLLVREALPTVRENILMDLRSIRSVSTNILTVSEAKPSVSENILTASLWKPSVCKDFLVDGKAKPSVSQIILMDSKWKLSVSEKILMVSEAKLSVSENFLPVFLWKPSVGKTFLMDRKAKPLVSRKFLTVLPPIRLVGPTEQMVNRAILTVFPRIPPVSEAFATERNQDQAEMEPGPWDGEQVLPAGGWNNPSGHMILASDRAHGRSRRTTWPCEGGIQPRHPSAMPSPSDDQYKPRERRQSHARVR